MLDIYHWEPNANSGKPLLAVLEKGVAYTSHFIDMLAFDQHKPEYLAVNPNGTIPAMVHDGVLVQESTAMIDYIDMAFAGPPLRPSDPLNYGACAGGADSSTSMSAPRQVSWAGALSLGRWCADATRIACGPPSSGSP